MLNANHVQIADLSDEEVESSCCGALPQRWRINANRSREHLYQYVGPGSGDHAPMGSPMRYVGRGAGDFTVYRPSNSFCCSFPCIITCATLLSLVVILLYHAYGELVIARGYSAHRGREIATVSDNMSQWPSYSENVTTSSPHVSSVSVVQDSSQGLDTDTVVDKDAVHSNYQYPRAFISRRFGAANCQGFHITDQDTCELAGHQMGLQWVKTFNSPDMPAGCSMSHTKDFSHHREGFFNYNFTSNAFKGDMRYSPICRPEYRGFLKKKNGVGGDMCARSTPQCERINRKFCCPTEDNIMLGCCHAKEGPFDGVWTTRNDPGRDKFTISGLAVHWDAAARSRIRDVDCSQKSFMLNWKDGHVAQATLVGWDEMKWSTSEEWIRCKPAICPDALDPSVGGVTEPSLVNNETEFDRACVVLLARG